MNETTGIDTFIEGEHYISLDVFMAKYASTGDLYKGYVIGYGYVNIVERVDHPLNLNGRNPCPDLVPYSERHFKLIPEMVPDRSPEMVYKSLKGLFTNGEAVITVKAGMTLSGIASVFNVTVNDLVRWNHIEDPNKIVVGQKITVQDKRKEEGDLLKDIATYVGYANLVPTIISGMQFTDKIPILGFGGFWRGKNGQYYSLSQANQASGRGWNFRANSKLLASNASKYLRWGGNAFSIGTTLYSGASFVLNPNWEDGLDTVFGAAGIAYWPIGVAYTNVKANLAMMPSVIEYNIERADRISKGDWSMAFWSYGRSVR